MAARPATKPPRSTPARQRDLQKRLRRIGLAAQGLHRSAVFGRGKGAVKRAIEHLGYVQIDTISVVERAHHHVLRSRVPNYQPRMLDRLVSDGDVYEYWAHAAAYLPMRDYRFSLPGMQEFRDGTARWMRSRDQKLVKEVRQRIEIDGPLKSRDFDDPRSETGEWWDWKPAKRALEQLFMQGDLIVTERDGFQKTYDLTDRALPDWVDTRMPTEREYAAFLVDSTLRAHGCAKLKSFTHLRRGASLRKAVRDALDARESAGAVSQITGPDGHTWFALSSTLESRVPAISSTLARVLSPFDNAVILRDRVLSLFDFDYTIECYVPAPKRKFGYFCLPLLVGDQLVGRLDGKAHRSDGHFEIKHIQFETPLDGEQLNAVMAAIVEFAAFNRCTSAELKQVTPKNEATRVARALETLL